MQHGKLNDTLRPHEVLGLRHTDPGHRGRFTLEFPPTGLLA
jgi:hypothetical protein